MLCEVVSLWSKIWLWCLFVYWVLQLVPLGQMPSAQSGGGAGSSPRAERAKDQGQLALEQVEVSACVEVPS